MVRLPVHSAALEVADSVSPQVTGQVERLIRAIFGEMSRRELQHILDLKHRDSFVESYLQPALTAGLIEMTIPDKPTSRLQKYRLTEKGRAVLEVMEKEGRP
jgi:hypothetical protein